MLNLLPFYYCIVSFGIFDILSLLSRKKNDNLKKIIISALALLIIVPNVQLGNASIVYKAESYKQVKDMAEFAKNIIPLDAKIIANASPQVSYYGEREILSMPAKLEDLYALFEKETNTNIIVLSVFEGVPEYAEEFNTKNFTILNVGLLEDQPVAYVIQYNRN
jgi:hypothetical protein